MIPAILRSLRRAPLTSARLLCSSSPYKPIKRPQFPASNTSASTLHPAAPAQTPASDQPQSATSTTVPAAATAATAGLPSLGDRLRMRIQAAGPITVAHYMREVLRNWAGGYYTSSKDVFGQQGDFITSPEINQIFGELIAVWLYAEWQKCGAPRPWQLVELGPGRGTMCADILRVLSKLGCSDQLSVHLVEISPFLSEVQSQRLCLRAENVRPEAGSRHYRAGETVSGIPVRWYERLEEVPAGFSVVLAHEFFDALPVHKFQLQDGKWREVLIDWNAAAGEFQLVASSAETAMLKLFLQQLRPGEKRQHIEVSFETQQSVEHLAGRLEEDGGFALVMDYGHGGDGADTFRAFKSHQLHDPLVNPGDADLTADVDFAQIQRVAETNQRLVCFGPVEQGTFLQRLGGGERLERLVASAENDEQKRTLQSSYEMLTSAQQMGARFKFLAMFPAVLRDHLKRFPVNGFH